MQIWEKKSQNGWMVNILLLALLIESIDVFVKNSISRRDKLTPKNKRG